ncbi:MAG: GNAT family N-acetyltransferase [Candidatus Gracilibacteria bacterium]
MKEKITIKSLSQKERRVYQKELLRLYDPEKKRTKEYKRSFAESSFVIVALYDGQIVGAMRIASDMFMYACMINLLVDPNCRGKGVGSKIMEKAVSVCTKKNIKYISLVADPNIDWLPEFYSQFGFEYSEGNGLYMELKRSK